MVIIGKLLSMNGMELMEPKNLAVAEYETFADMRASVISAMNIEGRAVFNKAVQSIFVTYPEIEKFSWTQYTPYFNDGDICAFTAYIDGDYLYINGKDYYDIGPSHPLVTRGAFKYVSDFLECVGPDMLETLFGDHAEIVITPTSIDVTEYEHD